MELAYLRKATELQHRKVEKDLDLLRSSFTLDDYLEILQRFYGFYKSWEPVVTVQLEPELPGFFAPRKKLDTIEMDLTYFGSGTEDLSRLPTCQSLPALEGVGSALGSVYVLEGSTLGGSVLARHFAAHLAIRPEAGCRYFYGYGERTGQMWSSFGALLKGRPAAEDSDMLAAAVSTFALLGDWLGAKRND